MSPKENPYLALHDETRYSTDHEIAFNVELIMLGKPPEDADSNAGYMIHLSVHELLVNTLEVMKESFEDGSEDIVSTSEEGVQTVTIEFTENDILITDNWIYTNQELLGQIVEELNARIRLVEKQMTIEELTSLSTKSNDREIGGGLGVISTAHNLYRAGASLSYRINDNQLETVITLPDIAEWDTIELLQFRDSD